MEASGITRWGTCFNVLQPEADRQIAGHWLPSRNDPALNKEATRVALRQGSFEPASEASPTDGGRPAPQRKRDSHAYEACPAQRPLLGVKRTWRGLVSVSANDPKRTFAPPAIVNDFWPRWHHYRFK